MDPKYYDIDNVNIENTVDEDLLILIFVLLFNLDFCFSIDILFCKKSPHLIFLTTVMTILVSDFCEILCRKLNNSCCVWWKVSFYVESRALLLQSESKVKTGPLHKCVVTQFLTTLHFKSTAYRALILF